MTKFLVCTVLMTLAAPALSQTPARLGQGPQPLTRQAYIQRIDNAFATVDANRDGFTDRAEMEAAQSRSFAARKAETLRLREAAFRSLDTNGDGRLTLQEFNSAVAAARPPASNATRRLARLDTNKDGRISAAENRAPSLARFDRADTNRDGVLGRREQRALVRR